MKVKCLLKKAENELRNEVEDRAVKKVKNSLRNIEECQKTLKRLQYAQYQDFVLSVGKVQITAKNAVITSMNISTPCHYPGEMDFNKGIVEIEFTMKCPESSFTRLPDKNFKPKIRNKKVEDCTIWELLFAVRAKLK